MWKPGVERPELEVGHDHRDLDQLVDRNVESRHLAVDPDEPVVLGSAHHAVHPNDGRRRAGRRGPPGRIRTCDQRIRRPLLYPLSYWGSQHPGYRARPGAAQSYEPQVMCGASCRGFGRSPRDWCASTPGRNVERAEGAHNDEHADASPVGGTQRDRYGAWERSSRTATSTRSGCSVGMSPPAPILRWRSRRTRCSPSSSPALPGPSSGSTDLPHRSAPHRPPRPSARPRLHRPAELSECRARREEGARFVSRSGSAMCTSGPMRNAKAIVPTPTVPPMIHPRTSTVISTVPRASQIGQPKRARIPVIRPSRGPGPKRAPM